MPRTDRDRWLRDGLSLRELVIAGAVLALAALTGCALTQLALGRPVTAAVTEWEHLRFTLATLIGTPAAGVLGARLLRGGVGGQVICFVFTVPLVGGLLELLRRLLLGR